LFKRSSGSRRIPEIHKKRIFTSPTSFLFGSSKIYFNHLQKGNFM